MQDIIVSSDEAVEHEEAESDGDAASVFSLLSTTTTAESVFVVQNPLKGLLCLAD